MLNKYSHSVSVTLNSTGHKCSFSGLEQRTELSPYWQSQPCWTEVCLPLLHGADSRRLNAEMKWSCCFLLCFGRKGCGICYASMACEWFLSMKAVSNAYLRKHSKTELVHKAQKESIWRYYCAYFHWQLLSTVLAQNWASKARWEKRCCFYPLLGPDSMELALQRHLLDPESLTRLCFSL